MTDADFIAWLKSPQAMRCVLAEVVASVGGVETTFYLSSGGYVTQPGESPADTTYTASIIGGCQITERMDLSGVASMAVGDIEIQNASGERDDWLEYVWRNRSAKLYVGDMRWERDDFRLVFDGVIDDIAARARNVLNLKIRDKLQRLNTPVTETKLGGSSANADRLIPQLFGEAHNITPLLIDAALLKYQVHGTAIERVIEVRDNGVPVSTTATLGSGYFVLNQALRGIITVSAQGDKPSAYANTVSKLVQRLATGYGSDPFSSGDLDAVSLAAFDTANPQPVGLYLSDRANVLECCQRLAASVGAQVVMTADGLLKLIKIELPAPGTSTPVGVANIVAQSIEVGERVAVRAGVKIGYCQNWTVESQLETGIPAEHKSLYGQEWLTSTASDAGVAADYKISEEPTQEDTLLLVKADADAEAARRLALWSEQRMVLRYQAYAELMLEQLGGAQTLTHDRFGLSGGKDAQILMVSRDWLAGRVSFEVLV